MIRKQYHGRYDVKNCTGRRVEHVQLGAQRWTHEHPVQRTRQNDHVAEEGSGNDHIEQGSRTIETVDMQHANQDGHDEFHTFDQGPFVNRHLAAVKLSQVFPVQVWLMIWKVTRMSRTEALFMQTSYVEQVKCINNNESQITYW